MRRFYPLPNLTGELIFFAVCMAGYGVWRAIMWLAG